MGRSFMNDKNKRIHNMSPEVRRFNNPENEEKLIR